MERRVTSHTEEEEMNQRRRLLTLARKGDQKSIELLFELYQVKVFSGDALKKKKLPSFPIPKPSNGSGKGGVKATKNKGKVSKVALASTPQKVETGKTKSASKGYSKTKAKTETTKSLSKKSTKPALQKKSAVKKASLPKKKSSGKQVKLPKLAAAKKPRIAKKK
jgi:hypothetical protein